MSSELLDLDEAARAVGVTRPMLEALIARGLLAVTLAGGTPRVSRRELLKLQTMEGPTPRQGSWVTKSYE